MANGHIRLSIKKFDVYKTISEFEECTRKAQQAFGEMFLKSATPYVPYEFGPLRASGRVEDGGRIIIWQTPYARRWFYEPANFKTPGTGNRWDLKAEGLHMSEWEEKIAGYYK